MEPRSRHSSYPEEDDDTEEEEPSHFRGRSRSAPPNLWAAQRYGRELRRMSDEFHGSSFLVSAARPRGGPVPVHAGTWTPGPLPSGSRGMPGPAVSGLLESQSMPGPVVQAPLQKAEVWSPKSVGRKVRGHLCSQPAPSRCPGSLPSTLDFLF